MSDDHVRSVTQLPRLPSLIGASYIADPPPGTCIEDLIPGKDAPARQEALRALNLRFHKAPTYALAGLQDIPVPFLKVRAYLGMRDLFSNGSPSLQEKNRRAYKAFLLFGEAYRVQSFFERWGTEMHAACPGDLIEKIKFPDMATWDHIDFQGWGDLFHQYGPLKITLLFHQHGATISPKKDRGTKSLLRLKFNIQAQDFQDKICDSTLQVIDDLAAAWRLNPNEYRRALSIYATCEDAAQNPHTVPEIFIPGEKFGLPGAEFYALKREDPIKLFLGHYTGCCEKISNQQFNIENTIAHSYSNTTSTFYIVADKNKIYAHSWAWIGYGDTLCFDGFESEKGSGFDEEVFEDLMIEIGLRFYAEESISHDLGGIYVGECVEHLDSVRTTIFPRKKDVDDIKPLDISDHGMNKANNQNTVSCIAQPFIHWSP